MGRWMDGNGHGGMEGSFGNKISIPRGYADSVIIIIIIVNNDPADRLSN